MHARNPGDSAIQERRRPYPRHPLGRVRRRWPRAYDGGEARERANPRYRRDLDGERRPIDRRQRRSRTLARLRTISVRDGLLGLAIAGIAAPVAVNRYQQALRTDPSHERVALDQAAAHAADDRAVMEQWQEMAASASRDDAIREQMEAHQEFRISRATAEQIYDTARNAGIDPAVAFGLVRAESGFRNQATSPVGAVGLTQLMPRTAAWMEPGVSRSDLRDPETNLRIGFKYLNYLLDKYRGDENLALLAYNRGPGTVDRILRRGGNPDNGYAAFVRGERDHGHTLYSNR